MFLVAAICCVVIPVNGQKAAAKPDAHQKTSTNTQAPANNATSVHTVDINKLTVAEKVDAPNKTEQNTNKSPSYLRRLIVPENLPNLVLCIIGIAGVIVAVLTVRHIAAQTDLLERSTIATEQNLMAVQRAFVSFRRLDFRRVNLPSPTGEQITNWQVRVFWQNVGNTAALHAYQHFAHKVLPGEPNNELFKGGPLNETYTATYIAPHNKAMSGPIYIRDSVLQEAPAPGQLHYFWGWIAYNDVFANTELHLSEFCVRLTGVAHDDDSPGQLRFDLAQCSNHNCVDGDCKDYKGITGMVAEKLKSTTTKT